MPEKFEAGEALSARKLNAAIKAAVDSGGGPRINDGQARSRLTTLYDMVRGVVSAYDATYNIITIGQLNELPTYARDPVATGSTLKVFDKTSVTPSLGEEIYAIYEIGTYDDTGGADVHGRVDWLMLPMGTSTGSTVKKVTVHSDSPYVAGEPVEEEHTVRYFNATVDGGSTPVWALSLVTHRQIRNQLAAAGELLGLLSGAFDPDPEGPSTDLRAVYIVQPPSEGEPALVFDGINKATRTVTVGEAVKLGKPFVEPIDGDGDEDRAVRLRPALEFERVDHYANSFGVMVEASTAVDSSGPVAHKGLCFARVLVRKSTHLTCGPVDDEYYLESGRLGARIIWREMEAAGATAGEGDEQWCLISIDNEYPYTVVSVDKESGGQSAGDPVVNTNVDASGNRYWSATAGTTKMWIRYYDNQQPSRTHYSLRALSEHVVWISGGYFDPEIDDPAGNGAVNDPRPVVLLNAPNEGTWVGKVTTDFTAADKTTEPPTPGTGNVRIYRRTSTGALEAIAIVAARTLTKQILKVGDLVDVYEFQNWYVCSPVDDKLVAVNDSDEPAYLHEQWADTEDAQEASTSGSCYHGTLVENFRDNTQDELVVFEAIDFSGDIKERAHIAHPGRTAIIEGWPLGWLDDTFELTDTTAFDADQALSPELQTLQPVYLGYDFDGTACSEKIIGWTAKSSGTINYCVDGGIEYDSMNDCYYVDPVYITDTTLVYFDTATLYINSEGFTKNTIKSIDSCSLTIESGELKLVINYTSHQVYSIPGSTGSTECEVGTTEQC